MLYLTFYHSVTSVDIEIKSVQKIPIKHLVTFSTFLAKYHMAKVTDSFRDR